MQEERQVEALEWLQPLISKIESSPDDQVSIKAISELVYRFKKSDGIAETENERLLRWVWLMFQREPRDAWSLANRYKWLYQCFDPKELPPQVLDIVEEILKHVRCAAVRARLLDFLASEATGKRRFGAAKEAVPTFFDALRLALQEVEWSGEISDSVQRGCALSILMDDRDLKAFAWSELSKLAKTCASERFSRFYYDLAQAAITMWEKDMSVANIENLQSIRDYLPSVVAHFEASGNLLLARAAIEQIVSIASASKDPADEKQWTITLARSFQHEAERRKEPESSTTGFLVAAVLYEQSYFVLKKLFSKYNEEDIRIKMENAKKEMISFLKAASYQIETRVYPLSDEDIEALKQDGKRNVDAIMELKTTEDRINALVLKSYVPDLDEERKTVKEMLEGLIAWRISPTKIIEQDRIVANYSEDNYLDFQVDEMILTHLKMHLGFVFRPALLEMIRQDRIQLIDGILKLFETSGLVDPGCRGLMRAGFEAWTSDSHAVALHMLIPRFEASIRRLFKANGADTVIEVGGAYQERTLDALLTDEIAARFPAGLIRLFRIVFTLQGRPNLRNRVCHGLAIDAECNELSVYFVLYCYLQLLRFEIPTFD